MKTAMPRAITFSRSRQSGRSSLSVLRTRHRSLPHLEWVEERTLLSTFTVLNNADAGPGSLRQAILDSDAAARVRTSDRLRDSGPRLR